MRAERELKGGGETLAWTHVLREFCSAMRYEHDGSEQRTPTWAFYHSEKNFLYPHSRADVAQSQSFIPSAQIAAARYHTRAVHKREEWAPRHFLEQDTPSAGRQRAVGNVRVKHGSCANPCARVREGDAPNLQLS
eukprot:6191182-Pleurochrysis_carterae.AAC.3